MIKNKKTTILAIMVRIYTYESGGSYVNSK